MSPPTDCRDQPHPELHIACLIVDKCYVAGLFVISLSAKFAGIALLQTSIASATQIAQRFIRQGVIPFCILRKTSHRHQTVVIIDAKAVTIYYMRVVISSHELVTLGDRTLDEDAW